MYLYNSATHRKEEFKTHTPGHVEMYTCGPTVYHFAHIGNLRSYIMEDVLEKYLRYAGYSVNRVMNITDVGHLTSDADQGEDKMLKGARREHKTVMEIAQYYTDAFFEDCRKLNIKRPDVVQPATGLIDDYIRIITRLLDTGYAYVAGGNVYFDTSKLERYYIFNDHNEEDLAVGVREGVEEDTNKRNKNDFVLWFTKSKFEDQALKWDSPWGVGYPGWHIECSGISMKYNGEYLDLHCGGIDNAFPHHTNEIAQSESYLGHPWCPQWCHVAHLNTSSGKMSKSKGEFLTVSLLEQKGYDPLCYRLFCLQSHYRRNLVFTWENLDNAAGTYQKLLAKIAALKPGEIMLLENTRFEKGETKNDPELSKKLASMADIFVNDAFGTAHRAHASTAGVADYLPAVCGYLVQKEVSIMGKALADPERPFVAILGGAKVSDKLNVINNLLEKVDTLIIGGGMAYTFVAAKGYGIGKSLFDAEKVDYCKDMMKKAEEKGVKILLPIDNRVADHFGEDAVPEVVASDAIPDDREGMDIGPKTVELFCAATKGAGTIVWNGPMGVFEFPTFATGTKAMAKALAESGAVTIIGGGDSAAAAEQLGFADKITHISTGGGASLEFLEGKELPGVACLLDK